MKTYGVIGYPLSHSFSKKYFTEKFRKENLSDCTFEVFEIPSIDDLAGLIQSQPGIIGCSVTIPYKEKIIPLLSQADEVVQKTGACNSIKIKDGKIIGFNTDIFGFEASLIKKLNTHHNDALILGRGGAAKAVAFVLEKLRINFTFVERIKKEDSLCYADLTEDIIAAHPLIINTTPLGMYPNIETCPDIPFTAVSPQHYLFDLTYNPDKTLFLQKGEHAGAAIQNGYEMLILQAEKSWELWNR
ncbi:shikimate dehydrogenase [soil metagenome]